MVTVVSGNRAATNGPPPVSDGRDDVRRRVNELRSDPLRRAREAHRSAAGVQHNRDRHRRNKGPRHGPGHCDRGGSRSDAVSSSLRAVGFPIQRLR